MWGRGREEVGANGWDKRDGKPTKHKVREKAKKCHLDRDSMSTRWRVYDDMMGEKRCEKRRKEREREKGGKWEGRRRVGKMVTIMVMLMILVITNQNWRFNFYCCDAHFYLIVEWMSTPLWRDAIDSERDTSRRWRPPRANRDFLINVIPPLFNRLKCSREVVSLLFMGFGKLGEKFPSQRSRNDHEFHPTFIQTLHGNLKFTLCLQKVFNGLSSSYCSDILLSLFAMFWNEF